MGSKSPRNKPTTFDKPVVETVAKNPAGKLSRLKVICIDRLSFVSHLLVRAIRGLHSFKTRRKIGFYNKSEYADGNERCSVAVSRTLETLK